VGRRHQTTEREDPMNSHDVIHTAYFHVETIEDMDDAGTESVLTCQCGEHSYGIGFDAREARQMADVAHREHRQIAYVWAVKNPELVEVAA